MIKHCLNAMLAIVFLFCRMVLYAIAFLIVANVALFLTVYNLHAVAC
jgi:hypothetical protein